MRSETKIFVFAAIIAAAIVLALDVLTWIAIGYTDRSWMDDALLQRMSTPAVPFILGAIATLFVDLPRATAWRIAGIGLAILTAFFVWLSVDGYFYQTQNRTGGANIGLFFLIMLAEVVTAILMPILVFWRGEIRRGQKA